MSKHKRRDECVYNASITVTITGTNTQIHYKSSSPPNSVQINCMVFNVAGDADLLKLHLSSVFRKSWLLGQVFFSWPATCQVVVTHSVFLYSHYSDFYYTMCCWSTHTSVLLAGHTVELPMPSRSWIPRPVLAPEIMASPPLLKVVLLMI